MGVAGRVTTPLSVLAGRWACLCRSRRYADPAPLSHAGHWVRPCRTPPRLSPHSCPRCDRNCVDALPNRAPAAHSCPSPPSTYPDRDPGRRINRSTFHASIATHCSVGPGSRWHIAFGPAWGISGELLASIGSRTRDHSEQTILLRRSALCWFCVMYTCMHIHAWESHAPGLSVHLLSIGTTYVGYISFICPG